MVMCFSVQHKKVGVARACSSNNYHVTTATPTRGRSEEEIMAGQQREKPSCLIVCSANSRGTEPPPPPPCVYPCLRLKSPDLKGLALDERPRLRAKKG